ncbi:family 16 glycosylhydrolase [Luedemannella flava]
MIFNDEFDGPRGAPPDPRRWTTEVGPRGREQLQYYKDGGNAYLDGRGHLVIEARREPTPGAHCPDPPMAPTDERLPCRYTSARLTGFEPFTYGRVEGRIRAATGYGLLSAFWLAAATEPGPGEPEARCTELDVMEHIGRQPRRIYGTVHGPGYCGAAGVSMYQRLARPASADFHTYSLKWTPELLEFSVDGVIYHVLSRPEVERRCGPWAFDQPHVVVVNLIVGGLWGRPPFASARFPRRMFVDYVRVYQGPQELRPPRSAAPLRSGDAC